MTKGCPERQRRMGGSRSRATAMDCEWFVDWFAPQPVGARVPRARHGFANYTRIVSALGGSRSLATLPCRSAPSNSIHGSSPMLAPSLGEAASCTPARASLRDSASPRGICLRSCERLVNVMYLPSRPMHQADAAGSRVSKWFSLPLRASPTASMDCQSHAPQPVGARVPRARHGFANYTRIVRDPWEGRAPARPFVPLVPQVPLVPSDSKVIVDARNLIPPPYPRRDHPTAANGLVGLHRRIPARSTVDSRLSSGALVRVQRWIGRSPPLDHAKSTAG